MPNVSKVILNGSTLMDATTATATADKIMSPYTAMTADGILTTGLATAAGSTMTIQQMTSADTSVTLENNKFYIFPTMSTLSVTVTATGMYAFRFTSGSTATTLTVNGAVMPDSFATEANKVYEVNIYEGYGVATSWTVS